MDEMDEENSGDYKILADVRMFLFYYHCDIDLWSLQ